MLQQVFRYGFVDIANNLVGYLIYVFLTWLWLDPKIAVSLLYPLGAALSYIGHAKYSFIFAGSHKSGIIRFVVAHFIGYAINILLLYIFVDLFLFPHQVIQIFAILVVAGVLFLLFRYYVFQSQYEKK